MTKPVRLAFIGCGSVMRGPYMRIATQLKQQGKLEIVAACDSDPSREQLVGEQFGIERFSTDYREVLAMPDVDAVMVLTKMQVHGEIARAALAAGKHVLVEKPMAPTLDEAKLLLADAQKSDKILHCAPHVILSPTFQDMWRRIRAGEIGKPCLARAFYGWAGPNWGRWFYQQGGGPLFDLGVYNVTSLVALLGPAKRVTALVGQAVPERVIEGKLMHIESEDNAQVLIDHGEGCYSVVTTGFTIQKYRTNAIEIYGTQGTIQMLGDDWDPNGFELYRNQVGNWELHEETDANWPWTDGLRHFVDCIQTQQKPLVTPAQAFHVLEIMLAAMKAGATGQTQTIESTFVLPDLTHGERRVAHAAHDRTREEN